GEPILDIINDSKLTLTLLVPSHWLVWLKEGQSFKVFLDELQKEYPAKITRIGARIDPVSQLIKVKGVIVGNFKELLAGMSGETIFTKTTVSE
ncbi:MAG: HlyD family efflux transporter periplasmic adaptor subunit, partial [Methylococcaceae bacterium]|nr:HlyD family efflux transporter periplasmic adaptor subunit [Methylococcaceae bacterium]